MLHVLIFIFLLILESRCLALFFISVDKFHYLIISIWTYFWSFSKGIAPFLPILSDTIYHRQQKVHRHEPLSSWIKSCYLKFVFSAMSKASCSTIQKQPSRGVLKKTCSEIMQQICRESPMPKCDFNKVALQIYWNHTSAWVFSCKFAAYFQNTFY